MELDPHTWELVGRYVGAGLALGFGGIGAAVGMGIAAGQANEGIMRQPETQGYMLRTMLIGQAVGGSPSIFALVVGLAILFVGGGQEGLPMAARMIGAGMSIGLGCFGAGWGCGWPAGEACNGLARNPRSSGTITQTMLVGQAVTQSSSIFSLVIAFLFIFGYSAPSSSWAAFGICLGAGIAMGAGALGPGIGAGAAAGGAVSGVSRWPESYGPVLRTMLIGQAVAQTPAILGLLVAFLMMIVLKADIQASIIGFAITFSAGVSVGFGGVGPGIGSGTVGEAACRQTAARPRLGGLLLQTMLVGQAVSQSTAIYAFIIALLLLYVM